MHVTVISPEAAIFDGEAESLTVPTYDGSIGVLPHHAPLMALLGAGELAVHRGPVIDRYQVRGGFVQVAHDTVRIVAEYVQGGAHA